MRRQLHAGNLIHGEDRKTLLADTHLATRTAVAAWRSDLSEMPGVSGSLDPSLVSLILGRSCFEETDSGIEDVLRLLAPTMELPAAVTDAKGMLIKRLVPVYASAGYRVTSTLAGPIASRRSIDRVKASRWAVIARSSFANA